MRPESKWRRYARITGPRLDADIRDEIEFHLQILTDRNIARGMTPDAARAQAITEFGDLARAREAMMEIGQSQERMHRRAEVWANMWQDARHGARRLLKSPGFTIVTVLTLAIGLGPNIAIFNIINSVLLKPLPYAEPDRLYGVFETFPLAGGNSGSGSVSIPNYVDWRAQNHSFEAMTIMGFSGSANLGDPKQPERLSVAAIDENTFPLLGAKPIRGRAFVKDDGAPGAPLVVVLGEAFWRRKYLGDETIVGSRLMIDGAPRTVVGIMPANIIFPNRSAALDLWMPFNVDFSTAQRGQHGFRVYGRLKPGVSKEAALADLKTIAGRIARDFPQTQEGRSVDLVPLADMVVGASTRKQLEIFLGAAGLVLLIACANAASLLLARGASRSREVAVLAALGATRTRVLQQFLIESLLVSAAAAVVAFGLAIAAVKGILISAGNMVPRTTEIHFDGRVVLFVGGAILLTTLVCGLAPALSATKADLQTNLRQGSRGIGGASTRFRSGLVVGQFALSLVLLAGAGLLLRTFAALMNTETGMKTDRVITMRLPVPLGGDKYPIGRIAIDHLHKPLLDRLRATPGVEAAGFITRIPLQDWGSNGNFQVVGKTYANVASQPFAEVRTVSPGYFATMGIPLLRGRDVAESDDSAATQVVVINQEIAKKYFAGEDPIGKQIFYGTISATNPALTVVGIVGSIRQATLDREPLTEAYFPYRQNPGAAAGLGLVIRTRNDPEGVVKTVQGIVRELDPAQPIFNVKTMREVQSDSISDRRLYLRLLGAFAGVALLLAMAGIYGVISYAVTQRTREFGIRLALGSESARIQRMVVWDGARLALTGLAIGVPGAFLLTRFIASVLYGVGRSDPLTYAIVAGILAAVSLLASYLPARRAVKVDPIIAMRAE
jgi:predicted permease